MQHECPALEIQLHRKITANIGKSVNGIEEGKQCICKKQNSSRDHHVKEYGSTPLTN
jgi:hypothetical protein